MARLPVAADGSPPAANLRDACKARWGERFVPAPATTSGHEGLKCRSTELCELCGWLVQDAGYVFATLIADERTGCGVTLTYVFYQDSTSPRLDVDIVLDPHEGSVPSISALVHAADWHEREVEDLFGLHFEGHPRLGEFVLHEDWPEGLNPMRRDFNPTQVLEHRDEQATWSAPTIVTAPGAFAMPVGPVFSDFAESAQFLLETVGEDVIHTIPRLFYKYRGIEKIAEGQSIDRVLLIAERFSGTSAFAHGLGFCQAIETILQCEVPRRARALRSVFAELERLRHHIATITAVCGSTALAVANSQAALIEEELLRLSGAVAGHRYLFGQVVPGGLARDLADEHRRLLLTAIGDAAGKLRVLRDMLRVSSSFLDRLEEVGVVTPDKALEYGLVGPVARASGSDRDMRTLFPYAGYDVAKPVVPTRHQGDGYARLRVLYREAEQSVAIIRTVLEALPGGAIAAAPATPRAGAALGVVEAPLGAAFHWVRLGDAGMVERYRVTPPSFTNWHGFHLAAENFAFQDFPIILASFGLSNAECDR